MTTLALIEAAGRALWGAAWQSPMARELGVADRTVRRWVAAGEAPADVPGRLLPLVRAKGEALAELEARLRG